MIFEEINKSMEAIDLGKVPGSPFKVFSNRLGAPAWKP